MGTRVFRAGKKLAAGFRVNSARFSLFFANKTQFRPLPKKKQQVRFG